ncbi:hypothetical protein LguiA_007748 [Lonicera macranthoides]
MLYDCHIINRSMISVAFGTEPTTGLANPPSANLWPDIPKRRLPHWPKPKPKSKSPKSKPKYAYVPKPKPPPTITARNPDFDDMYIENYRQQSLPSIQPLQNTNPLPPTPSFNKPAHSISQKTSASTHPSAYSSEHDSTSGASSRQMDMFAVHNEESMPENHISSFLKTLAMTDKPQFHCPMRTPHPEGDNAQITKWYPTNLAKSIKEPENVAYVTFLQEMCALNKTNYELVPDDIKFGNDPWITSNNVDRAPLFESDLAAAAQEAAGYEENIIPEHIIPDHLSDYDADNDVDDNPWHNHDDNHWHPHSPLDAPYTPDYSGNETD